MSLFPEPGPENEYLASHVSDLLRSLYELTGQHLVDPSLEPKERAHLLFEAPFFVASHNMEADPVLTYGNRCALELFTMNWSDFTQTPSRFTAETPERAERERLLQSVREQGYIDNYSGIRITSDQRRFRIQNATVWDVFDSDGGQIGQGATFSEWKFL